MYAPLIVPLIFIFRLATLALEVMVAFDPSVIAPLKFWTPVDKKYIAPTFDTPVPLIVIGSYIVPDAVVSICNVAPSETVVPVEEFPSPEAFTI